VWEGEFAWDFMGPYICTSSLCMKNQSLYCGVGAEVSRPCWQNEKTSPQPPSSPFLAGGGHKIRKKNVLSSFRLNEPTLKLHNRSLLPHSAPIVSSPESLPGISQQNSRSLTMVFIAAASF
jgi:hypothetical protein